MRTMPVIALQLANGLTGTLGIRKCKVNSSQIACAKPCSGVTLVLVSGASKIIKKPSKVLFPYDKFVKLVNWEKPGFPPCGLINCGNNCFANMVLQCLVPTRPLVAYLLEKGHRKECRCISHLPSLDTSLPTYWQFSMHRLVMFSSWNAHEVPSKPFVSSVLFLIPFSRVISFFLCKKFTKNKNVIK